MNRVSPSSDDTAANLGEAVAITSSKITFNSLSFTITGDAVSHQPRVTIQFSAQDQNFPEASLNGETTISQRNLNS